MMLIWYDLVEPAPLAVGRGGRDRDAALLFLLHPVHGRRAVVHFTQLVRTARIVEDSLGRRRLPGINVRHDADVTDLVEFSCSCHCDLFPVLHL